MRTARPLSMAQIRADYPVAPWDLKDEVELYACESGRTGSLYFVPFGGWFARFSLRSSDARLQLARDGQEMPTEDVWFHVARQHYDPKVHPVLRGLEPSAMEQNPRPFIPLDIIQMGRTGLREFLEKGNTWSGRGMYSSQVDAMEATMKVNDARREKASRDAKENAVKRLMDRRRQLLKIPFLPVGIDLEGGTRTKE